MSKKSGLFAGLAVGATLGLLFAPKKGEDTRKDLVNKIIELGKNAIYLPSLEECASYLKENVKKDDIVLTLGAGTVTNIGPMIVER